MVRNFNVDIFFFSCGGISLDGRISDAVNEEMAIRRLMMRHARRRILLCDSSKFGVENCFNLCTLDDIDELISDAPFPGKGKEKPRN